MAHILPVTYNVDFALVDEREKNRMQTKIDELGALISKLRSSDDEMLIETSVHTEREEIPRPELSTDELVDVALGIKYAQGFDIDVDLYSVDVHDVAPPTIKLSDARCHASLLSNFLLDNSLYFCVNEIISFQKLVGNLEKMIVANLDRQHHRSLNSYFQEYLVFVLSYMFLLHTIYIAYVFFVSPR